MCEVWQTSNLRRLLYSRTVDAVTCASCVAHSMVLAVVKIAAVRQTKLATRQLLGAR